MTTHQTEAGQSRPELARRGDLAAATTVVGELVAELQEGWDERDAVISDRRLAADVAWGSPFGATVDDADELVAIHERLKREGVGGARSRFEVDRVLPVADDVIVARVRRQARDPHGDPLEPAEDTSGPFSELVLFVLVRNDDRWWVAAGHNTPIRPGGAKPAR